MMMKETTPQGVLSQPINKFGEDNLKYYDFINKNN